MGDAGSLLELVDTVNQKKDQNQEVIVKDEKEVIDAIENNNAERLSELLQNGYSRDAQDNLGYHALFRACRSGHIECAELLFKDASKVPNWRIPLYSAKCKMSESVHTLINLMSNKLEYLPHGNGKIKLYAEFSSGFDSLAPYNKSNRSTQGSVRKKKQPIQD